MNNRVDTALRIFLWLLAAACTASSIYFLVNGCYKTAALAALSAAQCACNLMLMNEQF